MRTKQAEAVAAALSLAVVLCACGSSDARQGNQGTADGVPGSPATTASPVSIDLPCSGAQRVREPANATLGLSSETWGEGGVGEGFDVASLAEFSSNGYTLIKSPLVVSADAEEGTMVRVAEPETAALYYTTWSRWGTESAASMISAATQTVVVAACDEARQFPGGVIVDRPACVTLEIIAGAGTTGRAIVHVPIGASCDR